jgi:hypothetical protein
MVLPNAARQGIRAHYIGPADRPYRQLETSGRRDGKGELTGQPLAARTVR